MDRNSKYYGICFDRRSQNFGFHMIARSQLIAVDRRRSQTIAEDRTWFNLLRSSAIVCDYDRRIADDRRSVFPYDRRRSQNILRSAICDPRSSAIIWKPAFRIINAVVTLSPGGQIYFSSNSSYSFLDVNSVNNDKKKVPKTFFVVFRLFVLLSNSMNELIHK